ncbi:MAG: hypothetical protein VYB34_03835 [Planctomycetota bacterium]|nr:hypothetical protein [Planctomycetota bacterium]
MSVSSIRSLLFVAIFSLPLSATNLPCEEIQKCTRLSDWAPASITGYMEARKAGSRLRSLLESGQLKRLLDSNLGKTYLQSDGYSELLDNLDKIEKATGRKPLDLFDEILGSELLVASRLSFTGGQETLLLTRGKSEKALKAARKTLDEAVKTTIGFVIGTKKVYHEDHAIEQVEEVWFTFLGDILAITNSRKLMDETIDLAYGRTEKSVSRSPIYSKHSSDEDFLARAALRPSFIPTLGSGLAKKMDEPVESLLLSGIRGALRGCELMTLSLDANWSGLDLGVVLHPDDRGIAEKYSPFFPKVARNEFQSNVQKRGVLGAINISRDFCEWWENSEEYLESQAAGSLAQLSAGLSMIFGGLNFQDEVLPQLGKTISLVVRNQDPEEGRPSPSPAIPGGALILELKDARKYGRPFIVGFNSLVSIINITRMQQDSNAPSMLVKPEKVAGVDCYKVDLGLPADAENPGIEYNFSPSLAITGNRVIIGSTFDIVKFLVEESEKSVTDSQTEVLAFARDQLYIEGKSIHSILGKNLDFLAAQQVVEKGVGLGEARSELSNIREALGFIRDLEFESFREKDAVRMKLRLGLNIGNTVVGPAD